MLDELFSVRTVAIADERCLNFRHDKANCRRCVDSCPVEAISIRGVVPSVASEVCVRCGACIPACPTDAASDDGVHERRLVEICRTIDAKSLHVACSVLPDLAGSRATPGATVVRHGRCLSSLSVNDLLELSSDGVRDVALDVTWCAKCPLASTAPLVAAAAERANALFEVVGRPRRVSVRTATSSGEGRPDNFLIAMDSMRPVRTRRELFWSLRPRRAVESWRAVTGPPIRRARGPVAARLPHDVPASRRRLIDTITRLATTRLTTSAPTVAVSAELLPMAAVHVDAQRCSGCGLCARYCPTGALSFTTTPPMRGCASTFSLVFRADLCIDCDICPVACPENAISLRETIDTTSLLGSTSTTLADGPFAECSTCGLPTSRRDEQQESRCFSCRHGAGVVTARRDDAGLMADFLGRARHRHR